MLNEIRHVWDLDTLFPGGSSSDEFTLFLSELELDLQHTEQEDRVAWILFLQNIEERVKEAYAFITCLLSQNTQDEQAKQLSGRIGALKAKLATAQVALNHGLGEMDEAEFARVLQQPELELLLFALKERRQRVNGLLDLKRESLINDLQVDGFHAYYQLYNRLIDRLAISYEQDGEMVTTSISQASGWLGSDDRALRKRVSVAMEQAFQEEVDLYVGALNGISGFRLQMYRHREQDFVLKESLAENRISLETLESMWQAVEKHKGLLVQFLDRKAEMIGVSKLSNYDVQAPLGLEGSWKMSYQEAAERIVEQFGKFSGDMARFAKRAFESGWIDAEVRPDKLHTNFCLNFPLQKETRIFTTFDGTTSSLCMLAHELGHAYHDYVMNDLPQMTRNFPASLAETASTFAEIVVENMTVAGSTTRSKRLAGLETQAMTAVTNFMNAHYLYLFETEFYERRQHGPLSTMDVYALDLQVQKRAYGNALRRYFKGRWMQFPHLYQTEVPFYSYPYTFGYLLSNGLYARALLEGEVFAESYINFLRDTGRYTVEQLAAKHLSIDLTHPDFWETACRQALQAVAEFLEETKHPSSY